MPRWKLITLAVLSIAPVALFAGLGAWHLYRSGHWYWIWWTLPVCWGLSSLFWRRWGKELQIPLPELDEDHWTPQDQAAAAIVEAEQRRVAEIPAEKLTDPQFYAQAAQDLALKIARHYHPAAADPLGALSVVEILAAVRLISEDMEDWFLKYVPASHLITVSQWRLLSHAPNWWQNASNAGWIVSIALNPLNIGRFLASKFAVEPLSRQLQSNLLGTFYTLYIRQAGYYLIELNSGRLRGGSTRYRDWMNRLQRRTPEAAEPATVAPVEAPVTVTVAVIGQVKAGKSSLINCLLGAHAAATDILPATQHVRRYAYTLADRAEQIVLLDTPGYSDAGATPEQLRETREAVRQSDLVLLVLDVRSPARDADVQTLDDLAAWYAAQPRLKPPPLVVVLNKYDGLSPALEWSPPYDWRNPARPKERNIAAALEYAREVFGSRPAAIVPVCADHEHGRVAGVDDALLPAMSAHLDTARAAALLRGLHADYDRQRARQVVAQMVEAGKRIAEAVDLFRKPAAPPK